MLTWYTDGSWEKDSAGEAFYFYNYSKILQNMIVTLYYKNGSSSSTELGGNTVDGYTLSFSQNQNVSHWYPKEDEKYTGNFLTVSVLNVSAVYDVVINQSALFTVYGRVCDINGEAVSGASLRINGGEAATTDSNGNFSFVSAPGVFNARIVGSNIIPRNFTLTVNVDREKNNHTSNPIAVVDCDYVSDSIINAKDFAYIQKKVSGSEKESAQNKFSKSINFRASDYEELNL